MLDWYCQFIIRLLTVKTQELINTTPLSGNIFSSVFISFLNVFPFHQLDLFILLLLHYLSYYLL